jgi:transposase
MIYENDSKSDEVDAEMLARIARTDPKLLAPIRHRGAAAQADLAIIRARHALVSSRTQLVNHVRGAAKAFGHRVPKCSTKSFHKHGTAIPMELRPALAPLLDMIAKLTAEIQKYDRQVEAMAEERYSEAMILQQVNGVGPLTAVTYVLTIEDPHRFKKSRSLGPYLGLRPRHDKSGNRDPQLRITKAGDVALRRLLVGCSHYILGPFGTDSDLRRYGLALCERGGKNAKKRAVVAVARKLAVLLHRLWMTGEVYEPLRNTDRKAQRQRVAA